MQQQPDHSSSTPQDQSARQAIAERAEMQGGDPIAGAEHVPAPAWNEFAKLILWMCAGSVLMVSYVTFVNRYTVHPPKADVVQNAALLAARELAEITVQHPSFGEIGLCDLPPGRPTRRGSNGVQAISIDRVYETLKVDGEIADRLNHPLISKLVANDVQLAHQLEKELSQKLKQAVETDASQNNLNPPSSGNGNEQDNTVYRDIYKMLSADSQGQQASSIDVKVKLGRARSAIFTRDCPVRAVDQKDFLATTQDEAPYLVLVEATYDRKNKSGQPVVEHRAACALIAAPNVAPPPAAFVINFPAGVPPQFNSARDVLFYDQWKSRGDWQQAVGSNVPGKGSLAPPLGSVMHSMSPGDAMAVALHDWLKCSGPEVDPDRAVQLIQSRWDTSSLNSTGKQSGSAEAVAGAQRSINSCLAQDTGAREYSIMNQTGPGSTGQTALSRAFAIFDQTTQNLAQQSFPPSALPLVVDRNGDCNLAGKHGFDATLVQDFLGSLHKTNLAALSSLGTARQLSTATTAALNQLQQKMYIEKQELASVSTHVAGRMQDESTKHKSDSQTGTPSHLIEVAQARIATLKAIIEADERQRHKFERMHRQAVQAILNATKVANATFDLGANALQLCRNGIYRIDGKEKKFLVGNKFVFVPMIVPLTEPDFVVTDSQNLLVELTPWFGKSMDVVMSVESAYGDQVGKVTVEGKSLKYVLDNMAAPVPFLSGIFVLDSRAINKSAAVKPAPLAKRGYAFANISIPPGQLLYYCQNAVTTGNQPKVAWSILLRDLVASKTTASMDEFVGVPIPSQERDWCGQHQEQCPGLACELQIRCPLPVLDAKFEDSYLKNPMNTQVPQIPPVPPDML